MEHVVILNLGNVALGIARNLRHIGSRIIIVHHKNHGLGKESRYIEYRKGPDSAQEGEKLREFLVTLARELRGRPVLFPTRDIDVVFINKYRKFLDEVFRIIQPPPPILDRVVNKYKLAKSAQAIGINAPKTILIDADADTSPAMTLRYPAILKSVYAHELKLANRWSRAGGRKGYRADNEGQLQAQIQKVRELGNQWYVQEYISGSSENLVICGGYISKSGQLAGWYTARKLLQIPDDAGLGVVVETVHLPNLADNAYRLLSELGYTGLFEAEYKLDKAGVPQLIEVNPRHWEQHRLGTACDVNVSELAYRDACDEPIDAVVPTEKTARWIDDVTIFNLKIRWQWGQFKRKLTYGNKNTRKIFSVWDIRDPLPGIAAYLSLLLGLAHSVYRKVQN